MTRGYILHEIDVKKELTSLLQRRPGLTPRQIRKALGWKKSSTYKRLNGLVNEGVLRFEEKTIFRSPPIHIYYVNLESDENDTENKTQ